MSSLIQLPTRHSAVLHLRAPDQATLQAAVEAGRKAGFSYQEVGATAGPLPEGFTHDRQELVVGQGPEAFARACAALRAWKQFDLGWVKIYRADVPLRPGEVVAFSSRQLGVWALNVCRIVYAVDEPTRFGFAYGTLDGHAVSGEERFLVEARPGGEVVFEICKFSRLRNPLVRLVAPAARAIQRQFSWDALRAVRREVSP